MIERDLVLVGGGHTHALVLRMLAMEPIKGVRLTLVTDTLQAPYSGMLPGYIAGHYQLEETHINLHRLCQAAQVRLIHDRLTGINADQKTVQLANHRELSYDRLSINTGSTPNLTVPGAAQFALGVKPVSQLAKRWQQLLKHHTDRVPHWAIVGAGAAGVEVVLAIAHRFKTEKRPITLTLVFSGENILAGYSPALRDKVYQQLNAANVALKPNFAVAEVTKNTLIARNGQTLAVDQSLWCTPAVAPSWAKDAGLATDDNGFIAVNNYLQSTNHPSIFACGDVASLIHQPRPKAGVFAVRSARYLAHNLRTQFQGGAMKPARLQRHFLSLVSTGHQYAVGQRPPWVIAGHWVWQWKDAIDRKFMRQFSTSLPTMTNTMPMDMHCSGCGSKLGPQLLSETLSALNPNGAPPAEDAALAYQGQSQQLWQSIDGFRALTDDLYQLGQITTHHAVNDCYTMGLRPSSAQAWVNLAFSHPRLLQRDFKWLMSGICDALAEHGCKLIGGHSTEGAETHVALVVNAEGMARWPKRGAQAGDWLMMNKPLGSGILLAGRMAGVAEPKVIETLWQSLLTSNRAFYEAVEGLAIHAATDISGFGLVGHLLEMFTDSDKSAVITVDSVPLLPGALELCKAGVQSTLFPQLALLKHHCDINSTDSPKVNCLFDPQTQGGLLIAVAEEIGLKIQQAGLAIKIGEVKPRKVQPVVMT